MMVPGSFRDSSTNNQSYISARYFMRAQRFFYWLFDQVFPRSCLKCGVSGVDVCEACLESCRPEPRLDTFDFGDVWTGFAYENEVASALLQRWKYHRQRELSKILLAMTPFPRLDANLIVPVPLHQRRLLERGFNQAEVIARHYAALTDIAFVGGLKRVRYTKPQAQMGPEARARNVDGAFVWKGGPVRGHVLLVDDVCTTGSTLRACAVALHEAGADKVSAVCLLRGGK